MYYGSAEDVEKRLTEHNRGRVRYTKGHRPYALHYVEAYATRSEAMKREKYFKTIGGYRWLKEKGIL